jgi:hypothetical protein
LAHLPCWCDFVVLCYALIGVDLSSNANVFLQRVNTCPIDRKEFFTIHVRCCLQGTDYGVILVKPPGQEDEDEDEDEYEGAALCEVSI